MTLCDECINKENCGVQELFVEGELLLSHCRNFIGKAPHKIVTNFDRITASPEALAKFLGTWFVLPCKLCEHFRDDKCTEKISERHCDDVEAFKKWLNEECKE